MSHFLAERFTYLYPGAPRPALDRVSLSLEEGGFALVTGPSGGGKSTLALALAGLVPSFFGGTVGGRLLFRGEPIERIDRRILHAEIGVVLQDPERQALMRRVERELSFGPENLGIPPAAARRRAEEIAERLGIQDLLGARVDELSGGMRQRVCLGAAMAAGARTLVLDEPTSQLDPAAAEDLLSLLSRLRRDLGCTIVLVEQRVERCLEAAERVIYFDRGRPRFDGAPPEFRRWAAEAAPDYLPGSGAGAPSARGARRVVPGTPPPPRPILRLDRVAFAYRDGPPVLDRVSLELRAGEITALLGPNGAGKSTLLKLACGLLRPSGGAVLLDGGDPALMRNRERAAACGYLTQNPGDFLFHDTVEEEIGYTSRLLGRAEDGDAARLLDAWGLARLAGRNPRELSAGERQCVALGAAMAACPPLLLLDEPTRGQDPLLKRRLASMLEAAAARGAAVLLVTQDLGFAAGCAGRVVLLSDGVVAAEGPAGTVLAGAPFDPPLAGRLFRRFAERAAAEAPVP